jgi:hypothetical protein
MDTTTNSSSSSSSNRPSSDQVVSSTMTQGLESIVFQTTVGLVLGALGGLVLARAGASGARKGLAGLGAGIGLGSAWTRTSMDLEELLQQKIHPKK